MKINEKKIRIPLEIFLATPLSFGYYVTPKISILDPLLCNKIFIENLKKFIVRNKMLTPPPKALRNRYPKHPLEGLKIQLILSKCQKFIKFEFLVKNLSSLRRTVWHRLSFAL